MVEIHCGWREEVHQCGKLVRGKERKNRNITEKQEVNSLSRKISEAESVMQEN